MALVGTGERASTSARSGRAGDPSRDGDAPRASAAAATRPVTRAWHAMRSAGRAIPPRTACQRTPNDAPLSEDSVKKRKTGHDRPS